MLETIPEHLLLQGQLENMDIIYKLECQWKEEVVCETQILGATQLLHRLVRKSDGKTLSLAKSEWSV